MFSLSSFKIKTILVLLLMTIAGGSFVYTQYLIEQIREKERSSIELWATAMEYHSQPHYRSTRDDLSRMALEIRNNSMIPEQAREEWVQILQRAESDLANAPLDFVASELIIKNRFEIPSLVVDEEQEILQHRNTEEYDVDESLIERFASINQPISIVLETEDAHQEQKVYYGESGLITTLKYFPYIQFGLLAIFLGLGYMSLSSIKKNEQSNLWVGMAKEAAHQLGTPLSSLYGWMVLLKEQIKSEEELDIIHELYKDIERVQSIADRFNKIGSKPELRVHKAVPVLSDVMDYLEARIPKHGKNITLKRSFEADERLNMNPELFAWAIENLVKNAVDSIDSASDTGQVSIETFQKGGEYFIDVSDTGKGIEKKYQREVFNPGFSTKKRGWGLGLSLTKRIIEDYHGGRVYVFESVPGKGTTFRIRIPVKNGKNGNAEL